MLESPSKKTALPKSNKKRQLRAERGLLGYSKECELFPWQRRGNKMATLYKVLVIERVSTSLYFQGFSTLAFYLQGRE